MNGFIDHLLDQVELVTHTGVIAHGVWLGSLHWISQGYGYEMTDEDVLYAHTELMLAAAKAGIPVADIQSTINTIIVAIQIKEWFNLKLSN